MNDPIADYVRSMRRRSLAKATIDKRERSLRLFESEVGLAATREQVEDWLDSRDLCAKSRSVWLSHLHTFYAFCLAEGLADADPTAKIRPPKLRRGLPRPISDGDLARALEAASPLLRLWLLLGAYEGLRACEIAGLAREDLMASEGLLRVVHAKGGHERVVPLHPDVLAAVEALALPARGALFRNRYSARVTPGSVSHQLGDLLRGLGIESTPHSTRHRFASQVYQSSLDLRLTQELMGHASPATTSIYAAADMRKAAAVVGGLKVA